MPETVRILANGGIGDAILLTPSLKAMAKARPGRRIVIWSAHPGHEGVFRNNPYVSAFRPVGRLAGIIHTVAGGAKWAPYLDSEYSRTVPSLLYNKRAANIIAEILNVSLEDEKPELFLSEAEVATAAGKLANLSRPLIAVHALGACTANKNWDIANWNELVARNPALTFVQVGRLGEAAIAGAHNAMGTDLRHAFATIKACDLFAGVDSGLAHAAEQSVLQAWSCLALRRRASGDMRMQPTFIRSAFAHPAWIFFADFRVPLPLLV
jgi:ADP-heptose:LPS heptosyltransferase